MAASPCAQPGGGGVLQSALCEILEERSIGKFTVLATQLPPDHWSEVIGDPVIAEAIRDRLEHAALVIQITGENYRSVKARKLASKKKET